MKIFEAILGFLVLVILSPIIVALLAALLALLVGLGIVIAGLFACLLPVVAYALWDGYQALNIYCLVKAKEKLLYIYLIGVAIVAVL